MISKKWLLLIGLVVLFIGGTVIIIVVLGSKEPVEYAKGTDQATIERKNLSGVSEEIEEDMVKNEKTNLEIKANVDDASLSIARLKSEIPLEFASQVEYLDVPTNYEMIPAGSYWFNAWTDDNHHLWITGIVDVGSAQDNVLELYFEYSEEPVDVEEGDSISDEQLAKDQEKLQEYYEKYPLANYLPVRTKHFEINLPDGSGVYKIILYPSSSIINKTNYNKEIRQYNSEVLEWIEDQGYDPEKMKLKIIPNEV